MEIEEICEDMSIFETVTEFSGIEFRKLILSDIDLSKMEFRKCIFRNCDCSMADITECVFDNVAFEECRLSGVNFSKVNRFIFSPSFKECVLDYSVFEKNNLKNTVFSKCSIREATFFNAELRSAKFIDCDLKGTIFEKCNLEKADFTSSYNYFIDCEINRVSGAAFSLPEAINLLMKYNIVIK